MPMSKIVELRPQDNGGFSKLAAQARDRIEDCVNNVYRDADGDSPIECLMATALYASFYPSGYCILAMRDEGIPPGLLEKLQGTTVLMEQQIDVAGWRADFVLTYYDWGFRHSREPSWQKIIIECDGHDFHERTKEQAAKDRSRDRGAQARGFVIFRFTGSEIWADPMGCADQVFYYINGSA
jgi:very-short-patch-repair endonuclease